MDRALVSVHLAVADKTLRLALAYVAERIGHRVTVHEQSADHVVSDLTALRCRRRPVHTLVVDPLPMPCQHAVDAVVAGLARSVISSHDPEALDEAVAAAQRGLVSLPQEIVETANVLPRLPDRLGAALQLVMAGYTNAGIAQQLHQSESTVKRDLAQLAGHFGARGRCGLISAAAAAGFEPAASVSHA